MNKLVEMGQSSPTPVTSLKSPAFEVCHELKMLVDLMNEGGLNKAAGPAPTPLQYGDYTNTCIDEHVRERMRYHLQRIQDGSFARGSSRIRTLALRSSRTCRKSTATSVSRPSVLLRRVLLEQWQG